jgi:PAS domain S-box-containing protein
VNVLAEVERTAATEIERRVAWLRIGLVPILVVGERLPHPDPRTAAFLATTGAYLALGGAVLWFVYRRPVTPPLALAATAVDILAIGVLSYLSGGVYSPAHLALYLIPVTVAFRFRPRVTAAAGALALVAYLLQAVAHPSASGPDAGQAIGVRAGYLLWVGTAAVMLAAVLERRTARTAELAVERRGLEERYRRLFEGVPIGLFQAGSDGRLIEANPALLDLYGFPDLEAARAAGPDALFADPADRVRWLGLVRAGSQHGFEFRARAVGGEPRWVRATARVVADEGGQALRYEGALEDVTERRRAEHELASRARQQAAVAELGYQALQNRDPVASMELAVESVARVLDVEYCKVLELLPEGRALLLRAGFGWREGLVGAAEVTADRASQAGYTLLSSEPVVTEDLEAETRFSAPRLLVDHGVLSGLSVVVGPPEAPFGVLGAHSSARRAYTADDVNFVQAVANVLASAIERSRSEEALRRSQEQLAAARQRLVADALAAEQRARQSLAEALHDHAVQNLLSARHELQEVGEVAEHPSLARAEAALVRTIDDLREAIFELHPFVLDQAGLEPALCAAAERAGRRGGFRVECDLDYPRRHPHEHVLYSAATQLLANVVEHAHAGRVVVRLAGRGDELLLAIEDDGRGFDLELLPMRVAQGHIGIASQRERVQSVGGRLEIRTAPGGGTIVEVSVPAAPRSGPRRQVTDSVSSAP